MSAQHIAVNIPLQWLEGIANEELTIKQIFRLGLYQYKLERALQFYQDGVGSLGYLAEQCGIEKHVLIREARLRNIEPALSEQTVLEELGA